MLDLETLGTRTTSAIIQIGACYFDRTTGEIGETFTANVKYEGDSFTTDYSTIRWWLTQSEEARQGVTGEAVDMKEALHALSLFMSDGKYLWSHATFDVPILLNAYHVCGKTLPIHYVNMRDIRTLMDIADHKSEKKREGVHHNGLDDCKYQVAYVVEALNKLSTSHR